MSARRAPGRQSGSRAVTVPSGPTSAASPGKSSSTVEPAWPARAIHWPRRRAWRRASPRADPFHQSNPRRHEASSVRRPYKPGAAGNSTRPAPTAAAASNGPSNPASAQMATPNLVPAWSKTTDPVAGVNAPSSSPRCRLRCTPATRPAAANTWEMYGVPSGARSATPKHAPTPVSPVAPASAATAGWPRPISHSGCAAGSADPVSDISGNSTSSQPSVLAWASSLRWTARFRSTSPLWHSIAASSARMDGSARHGAQAAVTRGPDRHVRSRGGDLELLLYDSRLLMFSQPGQAFVVPVQAPDVAGVLAGPGQRAVQAEIGAVDRLRLGQPSLFEQQGAVGVPGRLHPAPWLVVGQAVVEFDRPAQQAERLVVVAPPVLDLAVEHGPGHGEYVLAGVVEDGP